MWSAVNLFLFLLVTFFGRFTDVISSPNPNPMPFVASVVETPSGAPALTAGLATNHVKGLSFTIPSSAQQYSSIYGLSPEYKEPSVQPQIEEVFQISIPILENSDIDSTQILNSSSLDAFYQSPIPAKAEEATETEAIYSSTISYRTEERLEGNRILASSVHKYVEVNPIPDGTSSKATASNVYPVTAGTTPEVSTTKVYLIFSESKETSEEEGDSFLENETSEEEDEESDKILGKKPSEEEDEESDKILGKKPSEEDEESDTILGKKTSEEEDEESDTILGKKTSEEEDEESDTILGKKTSEEEDEESDSVLKKEISEEQGGDSISDGTSDLDSRHTSSPTSLETLEPDSGHKSSSTSLETVEPDSSHKSSSTSSTNLEILEPDSSHKSSSTSSTSLEILELDASHKSSSTNFKTLEPNSGHKSSSTRFETLEPDSVHKSFSTSLETLEPDSSHNSFSTSLETLEPDSGNKSSSISLETLEPDASHFSHKSSSTNFKILEPDSDYKSSSTNFKILEPDSDYKSSSTTLKPSGAVPKVSNSDSSGDEYAGTFSKTSSFKKLNKEPQGFARAAGDILLADSISLKGIDPNFEEDPKRSKNVLRKAPVSKTDAGAPSDEDSDDSVESDEDPTESNDDDTEEEESNGNSGSEDDDSGENEGENDESETEESDSGETDAPDIALPYNSYKAGTSSGGDGTNSADDDSTSAEIIAPKNESLQVQIPEIEISHISAVELCRQLSPTKELYRSYLWIRINQYVPLYSRGFPLSPPTFTPSCLKWRLQPCRGTPRSPLLDRCTYWAPMKLQILRCIEPPQETSESYWVNYRPVEYTPANCPCKWPCEVKYDAIQKCEVKKIHVQESNSLILDKISSDGIPKLPLEVTDYEVRQLCKGIQRNFGQLEPRKAVAIHTIPFRMESASGKKVEDDPNKCIHWVFNPCEPVPPNLESDDSDEEYNDLTREKRKDEKKEYKVKRTVTATAAPVRKSRPKRFLRRRRKTLQIRRKQLLEGAIEGDNVEQLNHKRAIQKERDTSTCGIWIKDSKPACEYSEKRANDGKISVKTVPRCPGGWPCYLSRSADPSSKFTFSKTRDCPCDWPCLPFFAAINTCYDVDGKVLIDKHGRKVIHPTVPTRPYTERGFISCLSYMEKPTILCSIKQPPDSTPISADIGFDMVPDAKSSSRVDSPDYF